MKTASLAVSLISLVVSSPLRGASQEFSAATQFTLRNNSASTIQVDADPFGFFGLIQDGVDLDDETFVEFDLSSLAQINSATLHFTIESSPPGNGLLIARTFDLSRYAGSGLPDVARFGAGQFIETLAVPAQPAPNAGQVQAYALDVTAIVASHLAGGSGTLGFRMHHPTDVTPGSDSVPHVSFYFDSAKLAVTVPEPMCGAMLAFGLCAVVRAGRQQSQRVAIRSIWRQDAV